MAPASTVESLDETGQLLGQGRGSTERGACEREPLAHQRPIGFGHVAVALEDLLGDLSRQRTRGVVVARSNERDPELRPHRKPAPALTEQAREPAALLS